jgi:ADP-ribose pyrophosphatase YjhB (NUDIX family)
LSELWKPSVTVAAVMARAGRFCLVEEEVDGQLVYNQPAGHWERGETLADACSREVLE